MFILSLHVGPDSQLNKTCFLIWLLIFYLITRGNLAFPPWKFHSPRKRSSMQRSSMQRSSSVPPPPPIKSLCFPITCTICKQWAKFVACSTSSGDSGGSSQIRLYSDHVSLTFLLEKIQNSTLLYIGSWNLYSTVLWYA